MVIVQIITPPFADHIRRIWAYSVNVSDGKIHIINC